MLVRAHCLGHHASTETIRGAEALKAKVGRYLLIPLVVMAFMAFWSLITGRTPDLPQMLFVLITSWASVYFSNRNPIDVDAPPTRKDLVWAIVCAPLGLIGLGFTVHQVVTGIDRGIFEISSARDWTVSWAEYPFGFAFTILIQLVVAAVMLGLLYYSWFTIREWIDERR